MSVSSISLSLKRTTGGRAVVRVIRILMTKGSVLEEERTSSDIQIHRDINGAP